MTAIATTGKGRALIQETYGYKVFKISNVKIMRGAAVGIELATGYVVNMTTAGGVLALGMAQETVDNSGGSAGDLSINVKLAREVAGVRFVNSGSTSACAQTDIGKRCYFVDNQTVSILPTAGPLAGTILDVSATDGVLVELALEPLRGPSYLPAPAVVFTAADCAIARPGRGLHYLCPTTAANSTISLGSTGAVRGDTIVFTADGTVNGHTVQFRTGTTNISAALSASKALGVTLVFDGTLWAVVGLLVSP